jgi:hypothetical protein
MAMWLRSLFRVGLNIAIDFYALLHNPWICD